MCNLVNIPGRHPHRAKVGVLLRELAALIGAADELQAKGLSPDALQSSKVAATRAVVAIEAYAVLGDERFGAVAQRELGTGFAALR